VNYLHADVLAYHLERILRVTDAIDVVNDPDDFTLLTGVWLLPGDLITITTISGEHETRVLTRDDRRITVSPAVADAAVTNAVTFSLPHRLYTHKSLELTGDVPNVAGPRVIMVLPIQSGPGDLPVRAGPYIAVRDETRVALRVDSPFAWETQVAGETVKTGGFDSVHQPVVRHIKNFVNHSQFLAIPSGLQTYWRTGSIGIRWDRTPEQAGRSTDCEWHMFYLVLYDDIVLPGG